MEIHEFKVFVEGPGYGAEHHFSVAHPSSGAAVSQVRVRHRVRRLVEPELPDDDPDSGSTVVEDWEPIDLDDWGHDGEE